MFLIPPNTNHQLHHWSLREDFFKKDSLFGSQQTWLFANLKIIMNWPYIYSGRSVQAGWMNTCHHFLRSLKSELLKLSDLWGWYSLSTYRYYSELSVLTSRSNTDIVIYLPNESNDNYNLIQRSYIFWWTYIGLPLGNYSDIIITFTYLHTPQVPTFFIINHVGIVGN